MKITWISLGLALLFTMQAPLLTLNAKSAVLMDASNGRILYEKNGEEVLPMASTTKIMTCILALEYGEMEDVIEVSANAASMPDVQLGIRKGEQYRLKDLLYSLMLESHNDSAVAIAEHIGGSTEGFAEMMNQKAKDLGASHTYFITPNGLDAENEGGQHSTTAKDLAKIAAYAIQNETFLSIINTRDYSFCDMEQKRSYSLQNHDAFLTQMEGAIGIKTGFTGKAGYCFVGALKRDGKTLISVVLGSGWPPHKSYKWQDTKALMNLGLKEFHETVIAEPEDPFRTLKVKDGTEDEAGTKIPDSVSLLKADWEEVDIIYDLPAYLAAPVKEDTIIGYKEIYVSDVLYRKLPVYAANSVDKWDYPYCLKQLLPLFWENFTVLK